MRRFLLAFLATPTRSFIPSALAPVTTGSSMSKRSLAAEASSKPQQASLSSFFQNPKRTKVTESAAAASSQIIYCDLDGVLVDFDAGVKQLFPKSSSVDEIPSKILWPKLAKTPQFYRTLPWMPDGTQLWKALLKQQQHESNDKQDTTTTNNTQIRILTGCPMFAAAAADKYEWCRRELGVACVHIPTTGPQNQRRSVLRESNKIQVITTRSKEKHLQSGKGIVLIDDRLALKEDWEKKGGIFIHHTSTESTLQELRDRGLLTVTLTEEDDTNGKETAAVVTETKVPSYPPDESEGTDDDSYY